MTTGSLHSFQPINANDDTELSRIRHNTVDPLEGDVLHAEVPHKLLSKTIGSAFT